MVGNLTSQQLHYERVVAEIRFLISHEQLLKKLGMNYMDGTSLLLATGNPHLAF